MVKTGCGSSGNGNMNEYKAADTFMQSLLLSIHGAFKALLRPGSIIDISSNDTAFDKVSKILTAKMKDEINVDRLANLLDTKRIEFSVEPNILQSFHHLIQWQHKPAGLYQELAAYARSNMRTHTQHTH